MRWVEKLQSSIVPFSISDTVNYTDAYQAMMFLPPFSSNANRAAAGLDTSLSSSSYVSDTDSLFSIFDAESPLPWPKQFEDPMFCVESDNEMSSPARPHVSCLSDNIKGT